MLDKIILPEIPVTACHGVYEAEKTQPQPFRIGVEADLDLRAAAASDDVLQTLHYGELYEKIKDFAESRSFNLIETLADGIAKLVWLDSRVSTVRVSVCKLQAQHNGLQFPAVVEIERARHE